MITEEELLRKAAFEMLLKTVENLKCCGNCSNASSECACDVQYEWGSGYCDQWQSDNRTRKERERL